MLASATEYRARNLQILWRVDAEWHAVDDNDVNTHAGLERAQLLKFLASLEGGDR